MIMRNLVLSALLLGLALPVTPQRTPRLLTPVRAGVRV